MEEYIQQMAQQAWLPLVFLFIAVCLGLLGKSADWLVEEAVVLSERSSVPKIVIGATVVSLGTTAPEAAVSVFAAIGGDPSLALGNAVGSMICDTGLILGLACLISPLHLPASIVNRQGWMQFGAGVLLVACCWPLTGGLKQAFTEGGGGNLSQIEGFVFLFLLAVYLWLSVKWAKKDIHAADELADLEKDADAPMWWVVGKMIFALALVLLSSHILIPAVKVAAERIGIPEAVIAATVVAFGTSLPELVTAVTAARHGHGDLAVGNVVGADILNVLFVTGAAAAVTPAGLHATPYFFTVLFPAMLFVLLVFRIGIFLSKDYLRWPFGLVLLGTYVVATVVGFAIKAPS